MSRRAVMAAGLVLALAATAGAEVVATTYAYPAEPIVVDRRGLEAAVAAVRGQVVLLDFWALWCEPCLKGMPEIVKLAVKYRAKGLHVLAVSRDEPAEWKPAVVPFLKKVKAGFPCVVLDDAASDATVAWLGKRWRSELPARFVIDRTGKVVEELLAEADDRAVEAAVVRWLAKK